MKQFTTTCIDDGISLTSEVGLNNDGSPAFLDEFQPQFPGKEVLLQVTGDCQYRFIFRVSDPDPIRIQPDPGRQKWEKIKKFHV